MLLYISGWLSSLGNNRAPFSIETQEVAGLNEYNRPLLFPKLWTTNLYICVYSMCIARNNEYDNDIDDLACSLVNIGWSKLALCGLAGCLALVKSFEEAVCSVLLWLEG